MSHAYVQLRTCVHVDCDGSLLLFTRRCPIYWSSNYASNNIASGGWTLLVGESVTVRLCTVPVHISLCATNVASEGNLG